MIPQKNMYSVLFYGLKLLWLTQKGERKMKEEIEQCGEELYNWLIKWTKNGKIEPEMVIGILESLKYVYLDRACKVHLTKQK